MARSPAGPAAGRSPRLWIIDPSVRDSEDQGIEAILCGWGGSHRVFRPCLRPGDGPGPGLGHETDGVVLMGSSASVHDKQPWIDRLAAWMRPWVGGKTRIPLLGICFGHQLMAHLAGGGVGYARPDRSKAVGVATTRLDGGRLIPGRHDLRVVISHREEVQRVPPGFRVVAIRPGAPVDGLEHESLPIFSFQFHPEARGEFAGRAGFDPAEIDERLVEDSQRLLGAFRDRVADRARRDLEV